MVGQIAPEDIQIAVEGHFLIEIGAIPNSLRVDHAIHHDLAGVAWEEGGINLGEIGAIGEAKDVQLGHAESLPHGLGVLGDRLRVHVRQQDGTGAPRT